MIVDKPQTFNISGFMCQKFKKKKLFLAEIKLHKKSGEFCIAALLPEHIVAAVTITLTIRCFHVKTKQPKKQNKTH